MSQLRDFNDLSPQEKVLAVLGVVDWAISKEQAIELSGMKGKRLSRATRAEINAIFLGNQVVRFVSQTGDMRYILAGPAWRRMIQRLRYKSAVEQIGDVIWEEKIAPDNKV